jgi:hypothetical protein
LRLFRLSHSCIRMPIRRKGALPIRPLAEVRPGDSLTWAGPRAQLADVSLPKDCPHDSTRDDSKSEATVIRLMVCQ